MSKIPYASVVGSIMYTMVCTRPDISHAISVASRYMGDPGLRHWEALKWILRYLKGTSNLGIKFEADTDSGSDVLKGFVDSDFGANLDNRRSQTGYVFTLFGSAVSWRSGLQHVVALSTTEAEYMAMAEAVKESVWLRGILGEFGIKQDSVKILCDNQSALHLAKHQVFHERSKHIDIRLHFIRDLVEKGVVELVKVHTDDNASDMLTKTLSTSKFKHCCDLVNVLSLNRDN